MISVGLLSPSSRPSAGCPGARDRRHGWPRTSGRRCAKWPALRPRQCEKTTVFDAELGGSWENTGLVGGFNPSENY